jgi:hypothetical protein
VASQHSETEERDAEVIDDVLRSVTPPEPPLLAEGEEEDVKGQPPKEEDGSGQPPAVVAPPPPAPAAASPSGLGLRTLAPVGDLVVYNAATNAWSAPSVRRCKSKPIQQVLIAPDFSA